MSQKVVELANEIHDDLLKLVSPASPASIRASSLRLSRNPALFWICVSAIAFFIIFIIPIFLPLFNVKNEEIFDLLRIVGGAGLGSAFYALYTASHYVKNSTFNPKYSQTYVVRFLLGILSGIILALFLRDSFIDKAGDPKSPDGSSPLSRLSVAALALIGGYAAEAVARILDRVSETLVTLVSGGDKDKAEAVKSKATADAEKKTQAVTSEAVRKLQDALTATDTKAAVQKVIGEMLK
jgi:hypothetical protein